MMMSDDEMIIIIVHHDVIMCINYALSHEYKQWQNRMRVVCVLNIVTTFSKVAPPNGYFVMSTVSHTLPGNVAGM